MTRFKKVLKAIGKGFLVLLIVGAVVHGIASFVLGRRLEAEISKIKATGAPIAMAELGKPKVPDAENAAVIYAKITKDLFGKVLDPYGDPLKNSTTHKPNEDMAAIEGLIASRFDEKNPALWDDARKTVAKHKNVFPLLEEATSRPKCQFLVNWEAGAGALFPYCAYMKRTSQFLQVNALIQAHDGRMDEALRSVELGFKMSESLKDDPTLISLLARVAMVKIASKSLREILEYGSISEAQAKWLYDVLSPMDIYPGLDKAMLGEMCSGLWIFDAVLKQSPGLFSNFGSNRKPSYRILMRTLVGIWRPVLYADELIYLKLINKEATLMRLPYREIHSQLAALDGESQNLPRYAFISRIMFPIFARATASRDDATAEISGSQILLALQAYKDRFRAYPDSLDALRAGLGWDIPIDVYSGKDFIYKRRGNGFLLYSVGKNLKDDGAASKQSGSERYDYPRYGKFYADIIWQMDR